MANGGEHQTWLQQLSSIPWPEWLWGLGMLAGTAWAIAKGAVAIVDHRAQRAMRRLERRQIRMERRQAESDLESTQETIYLVAKQLEAGDESTERHRLDSQYLQKLQRKEARLQAELGALDEELRQFEKGK